ncbi:MAG: aminoglycoside phosphotransferase [Pseudonocardiaceae bacterium]
MTPADEAHREEMRRRLRLAAGHFSLTLAGEPTFGWRDRTIGSRANGSNGGCWLRVSWAHVQWAEGNYWTGNEDGAAIVGVPKPAVADLHEWAEENGDRNRAEVLTLVTDKACSETQELREELDLPGQCWPNLRAALETLSTHKTERTITTQKKITGRLLSFFGSTVDPIVTTWTTAHGDLNWTNLTAPSVNILDWESFGTAPAGYDAATLYCLSLLTPDTARKVHDTFSDMLDSPDGIRSQLHVIGRYLKRVEYGDFADLADSLHQHARRPVDKQSR